MPYHSSASSSGSPLIGGQNSSISPSRPSAPSTPGCSELRVRTASWKIASALSAADSEDSGRRVKGGGVMRTVARRLEPDASGVSDKGAGEMFWM